MKVKHFNLFFGCQIFKSFSDEARVRILHLLFKYEKMCTSDLELVLDFTQTKTSRHLTYLRNSGLITSKKIEHWVFYNIKEEVKEVINQLFQFLNKDILLEKDLQTYKTLHTNRELAICKLDSKQWLEQMTK